MDALEIVPRHPSDAPDLCSAKWRDICPVAPDDVPHYTAWFMAEYQAYVNLEVVLAKVNQAPFIVALEVQSLGVRHPHPLPGRTS